MKKIGKLSPRARLKSLAHASTGLGDMLVSEPNAWVHALATIAVLGLAFWLRVGRVKFCLLILAIVSVWAAEAFNTVLEIMADLAVPEPHSKVVRRAKDISAGAVLVACLGALAVGVIVLGPPLLARLS